MWAGKSWGVGGAGYGRIARGQDTAGIESWEITAVAMARTSQLRRNTQQQQQQAESQQESRQWETRSAAAADIVPGAPVHGSVHSAQAYQAGQVSLSSCSFWRGAGPLSLTPAPPRHRHRHPPPPTHQPPTTAHHPPHQAVLESWNGNLAAGTTPYQVASINSITYQVPPREHPSPSHWGDKNC